jgi:outer membrane protein TolC
VLSENEVLLNSLAEFTKARYNSSSQTENDLLLLQSEAAINRTQLALTDQEIKAQKTMLERYTGLSGLTRPDTAVLNMPNHVLSDEEIVRLLDEENPKLRQMEAMMAMNSGEAAANDKELIPDLMVEAMFMRMPQGMQLTTKTSPDMITGNGTKEYMYTLGASITLPFLPWTRKGIEAKTETLLFANKRIELEKNDMREEMLAQIRNAFARSAALAENEKTYREQVLPALEEAGDSAVRLYRSGNAGITKALEIRKMLLMEKMNYLMILEEEKMANIEAGMMLGISLDERN